MPAQLMPFNEEQFDRCAVWLATKVRRCLTQYDLVKFHVMTDVYHVLRYGRPVIGGTLVKWQFGPAVKRAYHRLMNEVTRFDRGEDAGPLCVQIGQGNLRHFTPQEGVVLDTDEFSQSEIKAMEEACKVVKLSFSRSQDFFHEPRASFMGKVWADAELNCPIDWISIIDAYDAEHGTDHDHIKELIALGV